MSTTGSKLIKFSMFLDIQLLNIDSCCIRPFQLDGHGVSPGVLIYCLHHHVVCQCAYFVPKAVMASFIDRMLSFMYICDVCAVLAMLVVLVLWLYAWKCSLVGSSLSSRVKYLDSSQMDCYETLNMHWFPRGRILPTLETVAYPNGLMHINLRWCGLTLGAGCRFWHMTFDTREIS